MDMKFSTKLVSVSRVAVETVEWNFSRPEEFDYLAGQHVNIKLPQLLYKDKKGQRRTFTLSSAPHEKCLKITTRQTGSGFKLTVSELPPGVEVEFMGPLGDMVWKPGRPAIFIAGGIGITPFKSIISEINAQDTWQDNISLWFSNSLLSTAPYFKFFENIDNPYFEFLPVITRDDHWDGESRRIDRQFIQEHVESVTDYNWYLCGATQMVQDLKDVLSELGVPDTQVLSESFFGY